MESVEKISEGGLETPMSDIKVINLTKRFGNVVALNDITFSFPASEVTCLLGPSGCGKTTLLRIIAGLETPTSGRVLFGEENLTDQPPRKRNIGMVFQNPVVYRGMSVYQNIELPLLKRNLPKKERKKRINEVLELMDLQDQADKDSSQLDNVSRQKVAVARTVAYQPGIILFDEPMTNIDANSRIQFKHFFKALSRKLKQIIIYVTHDQTEAMTLADKIALMRDARIVQCDEPRTLYNEPEDAFGGWFLGNPGMNFIKARCERQNGKYVIHSHFFKTPLIVNHDQISPELTIGIRPEYIRPATTPFKNAIEAKIKRKTLTIGGQYLFSLDVDGFQIKAKVHHELGRSIEGHTVWIELPSRHILLFDADDQRIHTEVSLTDNN